MTHDTDELAEQIENAIAAPDDERAYFIRQALQLVPDEHPNRGSIESGLERALRGIETGREADALDDLRGAYGSLPPGQGAVGSAPSSGEDARETYARAHGPDGLPGDLEHSVQADVAIPRELWEEIARKVRASVADGEDPAEAYWSWTYEYVEVVPNLVVDGEPKGVDDALAEGNGE